MADKSYVVPVALAVSLGINATLIGAGVAEGTSIPHWKSDNQMVEIPINLTHGTPGAVDITNLSIEYTYKATADFKAELQSHIPATGDGNVTIPFAVSADSAGKAKLSNLTIDFEPPNRAPELSDIPSVFTIDEGTINNEFLDLTVFFTDDRDLSSDLVYELDFQTHQTYVTCSIYNSVYLSVDATVDPDWNGEFQARVKATDSGGKSTLSNYFNITVVPVNDEPFIEDPISDVFLDEDGVNNNTVILNCTICPYFTDVEDDMLYFDVELDPGGSLGSIPVTATLIPKGHDQAVEVRATGDWNGLVVLRVHCDDDPAFEFGTNPYWDINVTVNPVNDPPVWKAIDDAHLDEDTILEDYITLTDFVTDVDSEVSDMKFATISDILIGVKV